MKNRINFTNCPIPKSQSSNLGQFVDWLEGLFYNLSRMRKWINQGFKWYYRQRYRQLRKFMERPHAVQARVLQQLLQAARYTEYGQRYDFRSITNAATFAERLPLTDYETLQPMIERMMRGERDVLWSGQVRWFSKSSGTTSDKSKFLPVPGQNLKKCHIRGTWDTMALFYHNQPDARQFECKSMIMGGSLQAYPPFPKTQIGDVSAIMIHHMPIVGRPFYTPDLKTALLDDWEVKLERLAQAGASEKRIVMIGGVPTWTVMLFRRILELTGKQHMLEVWPDFQLYIHGGVSFTPYRKQFEAFFPSDQVSYQEIYNASEGYFAAQDNLREEGMLLLLNNGIYYEFLPMSDWDARNPRPIPLSEVQPGKNYAIVISTNGGLWRYLPGDTVAFTSLRPYRIKVTGRTKQFINAFGEEVMVDNTDQALAATCQELNASVYEYTVGPIYLSTKGRGGHEWLIEFERPPADLHAFAELLDARLRALNSDYEAKRYKDIALKRLAIRALPPGTFVEWMRARGKIGGQHKVPRLANHRSYVDQILSFVEEKV